MSAWAWVALVWLGLDVVLVCWAWHRGNVKG